MTPTTLAALISSRPEFAKPWGRVFETPVVEAPEPGPEPLPREEPDTEEWKAWAQRNATRSAWEAKVRRAGRLHPDAAFEIARALQEEGQDVPEGSEQTEIKRLDQLRRITHQDVVQAKTVESATKEKK